MATTEAYIEEFDVRLAQGALTGPAWLRPLRQAAISRFREIGFPTRRDEEWRFTDIRPTIETPFVAPVGVAEVDSSSIEEFAAGASGGVRLVFVDGRLASELSRTDALPAGVRLESLASVLRDDPRLVEADLGRYAAFERQPFVALNTALFEDGPVVVIEPNAAINTPIHLVYWATAGAEPRRSDPRALIVAGRGSQATVVESFAGQPGAVYLTNAVTEIVVGENANLDHYKVQRESANGYHIATQQVELARSAVFTSHSIGLGGAIVRNDVNARMGGEGAECTLNGLHIAGGRQVVDNHTFIDHALPHCPSHELYKHVLDGRAHAVFNGKIMVREDAQKTDAKQTNKTLLLSREAQINTKPQLEIFADDVKCTHGATVGQLDAEALFYLRARGIGLEEARHLLIYAFAGDIVSRIQVPEVRERLDAILLRRLG